MRALTLTILLSALMGAGAQAADAQQARWVKASPLLLREAPSPQAAVRVRLQQGREVVLLGPEGGDYCNVHVGEWLQGFVACRYLSRTEVPPRRAGEGEVPVDTRWVQVHDLVLRATPSPQGVALGRLALNTELRQLSRTGHDANAYCEVVGVPPAGTALQGFTACRYLADTPLDELRLSLPRGASSRLNPDFDPKKAFDLRPEWDTYGRYLRFVQSLCESASSCAGLPPDHAANLAHMRRALHGQAVSEKAPAPEWPTWHSLLAPKALVQDALRIYPQGEETPAGAQQRAQVLLRALVLPAVAPSWFRSAGELAGPGESLPELAQRFDAQQRWFVGALDQPGQPALADARIERLTRRVQRIELLADGTVRAALHTPQRVNREWLPDVDFMCQNWPGPGFAHGDTDAATRRRNGWEGMPAGAGPLRLFWLHSLRELPPGPARSERRTVELDLARTGFRNAELRSFDLDADGQPDLMTVQATGRAPGHIDGPLAHDDPWWRLLLVNLGGQWRLLSVDTISYGCGC
jgi:hypothetical protein